MSRGPQRTGRAEGIASNQQRPFTWAGRRNADAFSGSAYSLCGVNFWLAIVSFVIVDEWDAMRTLLAAVIIAGCTVGCASRPPRANAARQMPMPQPATFHVSGTLTVNLTPQLVAQTGLPQAIRGSLEASAHSEAISAQPLRSQHDGHMKLALTDGEGKRSLANVDIDVRGDSDGSPTEGLGLAIRRFLDAASIMMRPIPQSGARR
jgi:hypothetical protein